MMIDTPTHYRAPGWFTRNVFNRTVAGLTRIGVSVLGSRVLETKGRQSGQPRRTPVNLLSIDGHEYLVSPRGHSQWVRNVRADDGRLTLILGKRRKGYVARELPVDDAQTAQILRAYLKRWKAEVGIFFDGAGPDSTDAELAAIAPKHPIFELTAA
ncbi:MAG: hypothetical protein JWM76_676 [Pseudonocardiales bacterium]|nr:hypothetical protein [Pseudonocardiales bacterium]